MNAPTSPADLQPASAAATNTPRVDLYAPIHKAMRHFMTDTLHRVGRVDVHDDADMTHTLGQLDALLKECEAHIRHEDEFMHTAMEARQPRGSGRTADDHLEHHESIDALRSETAALRLSTQVFGDRAAHAAGAGDENKIVGNHLVNLLCSSGISQLRCVQTKAAMNAIMPTPPAGLRPKEAPGANRIAVAATWPSVCAYKACVPARAASPAGDRAASRSLVRSFLPPDR